LEIRGVRGARKRREGVGRDGKGKEGKGEGAQGGEGVEKEREESTWIFVQGPRILSYATGQN